MNKYLFDLSIDKTIDRENTKQLVNNFSSNIEDFTFSDFCNFIKENSIENIDNKLKDTIYIEKLRIIYIFLLYINNKNTAIHSELQNISNLNQSSSNEFKVLFEFMYTAGWFGIYNDNFSIRIYNFIDLIKDNYSKLFEDNFFDLLYFDARQQENSNFISNIYKSIQYSKDKLLYLNNLIIEKKIQNNTLLNTIFMLHTKYNNSYFIQNKKTNLPLFHYSTDTSKNNYFYEIKRDDFITKCMASAKDRIGVNFLTVMHNFLFCEFLDKNECFTFLINSLKLLEEENFPTEYCLTFEFVENYNGENISLDMLKYNNIEKILDNDVFFKQFGFLDSEEYDEFIDSIITNIKERNEEYKNNPIIKTIKEILCNNNEQNFEEFKKLKKGQILKQLIEDFEKSDYEINNFDKFLLEDEKAKSAYIVKIFSTIKEILCDNNEQNFEEFKKFENGKILNQIIEDFKNSEYKINDFDKFLKEYKGTKKIHIIKILEIIKKVLCNDNETDFEEFKKFENGKILKQLIDDFDKSKYEINDFKQFILEYKGTKKIHIIKILEITKEILCGNNEQDFKEFKKLDRGALLTLLVNEFESSDYIDFSIFIKKYIEDKKIEIKDYLFDLLEKKKKFFTKKIDNIGYIDVNKIRAIFNIYDENYFKNTTLQEFMEEYKLLSKVKEAKNIKITIRNEIEFDNYFNSSYVDTINESFIEQSETKKIINEIKKDINKAEIENIKTSYKELKKLDNENNKNYNNEYFMAKLKVIKNYYKVNKDIKKDQKHSKILEEHNSFSDMPKKYRESKKYNIVGLVDEEIIGKEKHLIMTINGSDNEQLTSLSKNKLTFDVYIPQEFDNMLFLGLIRKYGLATATYIANKCENIIDNGKFTVKLNNDIILNKSRNDISDFENTIFGENGYNIAKSINYLLSNKKQDKDIIKKTKLAIENENIEEFSMFLDKALQNFDTYTRSLAC